MLLKVKLNASSVNKKTIPEICRPWETKQRVCPEDVAADRLHDEVLILRPAHPGFWSRNWIEWAA